MGNGYIWKDRPLVEPEPAATPTREAGSSLLRGNTFGAEQLMSTSPDATSVCVDPGLQASVGMDASSPSSPGLSVLDAVARQESGSASGSSERAIGDKGDARLARNSTIGSAIAGWGLAALGTVPDNAKKGPWGTALEGLELGTRAAKLGLDVRGKAEGERQIAGTDEGHLANTGAKVLVDELVGAGAEQHGARSPGVSVSPGDVARSVKTANEATLGWEGVSRGADMAGEADLRTQIKNGAYNFVDMATIASMYAQGDKEGGGDAMEALDSMIRDGERGGASQGYAHAASAALGDKDETTKAVSGAAERGEKGSWLALGNMLGDFAAGSDQAEDLRVHSRGQVAMVPLDLQEKARKAAAAVNRKDRRGRPLLSAEEEEALARRIMDGWSRKNRGS